MIETKAKIYEFDGFRLETDERRFFKNGEEVALSSKAFDLLQVLVENRGHLVTKEDLYKRVWADAIVEDANLTVQISAIRKVLGSREFIRTVKGHGYRFTSDVRILPDSRQDFIIERTAFSRVTVEREDETLISDPATTASTSARRTRLRFIGAAVAFAALIGIGGYAWRSGSFSERTSTAAEFQSGSIKRLTSTGRISNAAAISPDGKLFAYSQSEGETQSLWIGHVGGGEPMQVRPPAEVIYRSVHFSPDGDGLYYTVADGGLYRVPVFGGVPEKVRDSVNRSIAFSPDGKGYAFVRNGEPGGPAVVVFSTDGREENLIGVPPTNLGFVHNSLAWSPDG